MRFKDWLQQQTIKETGTSTADIAGFSRPCLPMVSRQWPNDGKDEKKKKSKKA